ncbi:MAG TPA: universal stress protein [Terriglobales bacterium]
MSASQQLVSTRVMLDNILFSTDFSEAAQAALPYALALAKHYGSTLHTVHVLPELSILLHTDAENPVTFESAYEAERRKALERIKLLSPQIADLPHHIYARRGNTWEVISGLVAAQNIDLLILGTHGRTGIGKLVLGSVAEEVLRNSLRPVMTVGPRARVKHEFDASGKNIRPIEIGFRHILVATDFVDESLAAVPFAVSLAEEFQTKLGLLHVIEPQRPTPGGAALERLENLVPQEARLWCRPASILKFGSPGERILETAAECNSDLIVMGVRTRKALLASATHFPWSTAHRVIVEAACPVLTVRK